MVASAQLQTRYVPETRCTEAQFTEHVLITLACSSCVVMQVNCKGAGASETTQANGREVQTSRREGGTAATGNACKTITGVQIMH